MNTAGGPGRSGSPGGGEPDHESIQDFTKRLLEAAEQAERASAPFAPSPDAEQPSQNVARPKHNRPRRVDAPSSQGLSPVVLALIVICGIVSLAAVLFARHAAPEREAAAVAAGAGPVAEASGSSDEVPGGDPELAAEAVQAPALDEAQVDEPAARVTAIAVPGRIEAEAVALGGEGVSFHESNFTRSGDVFLQQGLDVQSYAEASNGQYFNWIRSGEWFEYDIVVVQAGRYQTSLGLASKHPGEGAVEISVDGVGLATMRFTLPANGWQSFSDLPGQIVYLPGGAHRLRVTIRRSGFNWDYLDLEPVSDLSAPPGD